MTLVAEPIRTLNRTNQSYDLRIRAKQLLNTEIAFIDNPSFREALAEEEILDGTTFDHVTIQSNPTVRAWPAHLARLCDAPLLTAAEERQLFRLLNYSKYRANALRSRIDLDDPDQSQVLECEMHLERAKQVRDCIIRANTRLVISIIKKYVTPSFSFDELLSDGIVILMNAVEKFDYQRGFRFSTYAYRSIGRNAYKQVMERKQEMGRFANVPEDCIEETLDQGEAASMDEKTWERLRTMLSKLLGKLDKRERVIVKARYALGKHRKIQTFQSIADRLGVSKERIRQLEQRAVGKLQKMVIDVGTEA
jgi:RNA polymerase primary sigma factor